MRHSLAGTTAPLAVADYTYDALPASARDAVPTDTELATAAGDVIQLTATDPPGKPPERTASNNRQP